MPARAGSPSPCALVQGLAHYDATESLFLTMALKTKEEKKREEEKEKGELKKRKEAGGEGAGGGGQARVFWLGLAPSNLHSRRFFLFYEEVGMKLRPALLSGLSLRAVVPDVDAPVPKI